VSRALCSGARAEIADAPVNGRPLSFRPTPDGIGGAIVVNPANLDERKSGLRTVSTGRPLRPASIVFASSAATPPSPRPIFQSAPRHNTGEQSVDVICAGMYRACSTWQYEVVAHLVEESLGGRRLGYLTPDEYATHVQRGARPATGSDESAGWCVVKAHEGDRSFARELADGRARAVYVHRDVREVVFSLMHKRGLTFEQLVREGMIHQVLANDRFWTAQADILIQRYDEILSDPATSVQQLARHLGIALADDDAVRIAGEYSRESNRARTEALRRRLEQAGVDLDSTDNAQICDSATLLHWNHMRQAGAGSWETKATPSQRATLHRLCGRWLRTRGYDVGPNPSNFRFLVLRAWRELVRIESDVFVGRVNFTLRAATQRFPGVARTVKRLLGMPVESKAGATAWSDPVSSERPARRSSDVAAGA
jgi:hypothetical protein